MTEDRHLHAVRPFADQFDEDGLDRAAEEDLKACAQQGHVEIAMVCQRCGEILGEVEP